MTGTVLDVEPQDFVTSSGSAAATSRAIASAGSSLRSALASSSHMAGSDPAGRKWATQYDTVAADAVAGIDALDTAFGQIAAGLAVTGLNYATADWLSAGRSGHAPGYTVPALPAPACSATSPSSSGGTGGSTIPGWHYVADFIGEMWPDGDAGKLRGAEAAWKAFADDLDSIRSGTAARINSDLDGTVTPEMATITSTVATVGSHLNDLAEEARNLGSAAGALATQIDHVHQQTEQVLVELGEQIAATAAVGIGLTIVTAGLSDAAGALAAGGEIAAAVARILGFIAELGANVARVVDGIAVSAGSVARVAGISEQITIRVVTIAGRSVVTGAGGAVTNVGVTEILDPGADLGEAAVQGFVGGAAFGVVAEGGGMILSARNIRLAREAATVAKPSTIAELRKLTPDEMKTLSSADISAFPSAELKTLSRDQREVLRGVDIGTGRDVFGQYAGADSISAIKEAQGLADYARQFGITPSTVKVRASLAGRDQARYFDGLVKKPDGTYEGVEVKSGSAAAKYLAPGSIQREFDGLISASNPATAVLDGQRITITSVRLMKVQ